MTAAAELRDDRTQSKKKQRHWRRAPQSQEVTKGRHWANNTVTTAYVDDTANAKGVSLRGLNVDSKISRIHQRIRLYVRH